MNQSYNKQDKNGYSRQSLRSGVISVASYGINAILQIGSMIFMARLLLPEDFGLVAMVSALTGFAPVLIDLGMKDATVQKANITQDEISALFWLTVFIGGSLAVVTILCSPLIAKFYNEVRLEKIAQVSALTFILSALSSQHTALLRRAMMFNKIAVIDIIANLLATGGALAMAFAGYGYWSLVSKPILTAFLTTGGIWLSCRWWPGIPSFSQSVKDMLKFGLNITGFTMVDYVARAADRVALGYVNGAKELGYYQNASTMYQTPLGLITVPLHMVAVASLSKLQKNVEELKRSWSEALSAMVFFAMPAFSILAVTGQDIAILVLGSKWITAGSILSIIALRGPVHVVERTVGWLHVPAGRGDRWMKWGVLSCLVHLISLLFGLPYGVMGIAIAYTVCAYILFVPAIIYAGRPFDIRFYDLIRTIGPQLFGAIYAVVIGFLLRCTYLVNTPILTRILVLILACAMSYLLVTVCLFRIVKPLVVAWSIFQNFLPSRNPVS